MKPVLLPLLILGRKVFLFVSVAIALLTTVTAVAVDTEWSNSGDITSPPNIDAINFYNVGDWDIFVLDPVQSRPFFFTQDTYNYYNNGTMTCTPGWSFGYYPASGSPGWSSTFTNDNQGNIITGSEAFNFTSVSRPPIGYLLISATNIVNKGQLSADAYSKIALTGSSINLTRSSIEIEPLNDSESGFDDNNKVFDPSASIYDLEWGVGEIKKPNQLATRSFWNGVSANLNSTEGLSVNVPCTSVAHTVGLTGNGSASAGVAFTNYLEYVTNLVQIIATNVINVTNGAAGDVTTNNVSPPVGILFQTNAIPTNVVRQALFVSVPDNTYTIGGVFGRDNVGGDTSSTNPFTMWGVGVAAISISRSFPNNVTGDNDSVNLFLFDKLAAEESYGTYQNTQINPYGSCSGPTFRPRNYVLTRAGNGFLGSIYNGANYVSPVPTNFLWQTDFTNANADATYSIYEAYVDNQGIQIQNGASITNEPGRVDITADNLDLTKARIRAEGQVTIQAKHLVGSKGASIDCQSLSYNVGSTNGSLTITNMAAVSVQRLSGDVTAGSAVWDNTGIFITNIFITNVVAWVTNDIGTNGDIVDSIPGPILFDSFTNIPMTNSVAYNLAATLMNASGLISSIPVQNQDLLLHGTNITIGDSMTVVRSLLIDGQSLTLDGDLTLADGIQNWTAANAPTLLYFTNNGALTIPNNAHFGDDGTTNYLAFINNGSVNAVSESIDSSYYQNSGRDNVGAFVLTAGSGLIQNGNVSSSQYVNFNADTLRLNHATIISSRSSINFDVTNLLADAGASSSNSFTCNDGFNLLIKPQAGDLLGTKITSVARTSAEYDSIWAGEDRGATAAGFLNNVAIGRLILSPQGNFEPLFTFSGAGDSNAMYVDDLDLSQLSSSNFDAIADQLQINPNLVIYFASAELGFTPPATNGIPMQPEEFLDGQLDGHLRWVSNYAGPNSSVNVIINGQTVAVNRALRDSKLIDSDGDGIPNYYDTDPFSIAGFTIAASLTQTNQLSARSVQISWSALPNTIYQVEYTTNLLSANWLPLFRYTNSSSAQQPVTMTDTNVSSDQRFYRESAVSQFQSN